jgi:DNA-binding HxlR family transcriptional regulator
MSTTFETEMWFGDPLPVEEPPLDDVFSLLDHTWIAHVVLRLGERPFGYNELYRAIPGISQKMLTDALGRLERNRLVHRDSITTRPRRIRYRLTTDGESLLRLLQALSTWDSQRAGVTDVPR